MTYFIHQLPGRLRVRTPALKQNQKNATKVRWLLSSIAGIRSININEATGSLIIRFDEKRLDAGHLLTALHHGGFTSNIVGFPRRRRSVAPAAALAKRETTATLEPLLAEIAKNFSEQLLKTMVEKAVTYCARRLVSRIF